MKFHSFTEYVTIQSHELTNKSFWKTQPLTLDRQQKPTGIKNTAAAGLKTRKNIIAPQKKKTHDKKTKTHPVFYSNFTDQAAKSKSTSRKTGRLVSGPTSLGAWPGRDEAKTDAAGSKVGLWNPGPSFTKEMSAKRKSSPKTTGNQRGK